MTICLRKDFVRMDKRLYCQCPFISTVGEMHHILERRIREEHKSVRDCIPMGTWGFELRNHGISHLQLI